MAYPLTSDPYLSSGAPDLFDTIMGLLRTLGIQEIVYSLNGGGDSGETSIDRVVFRDEREESRLPTVPIAVGPVGGVVMLESYLENFAADHPEGDWVNNEGGYGTVTIFPFASDGDSLVECDMTYGDEGDYGDDDEDLDPIDLGLPNDFEAKDMAVEILIDGEMQP